MAYLHETLPLERIRYAPGATIDREVPRGNLFAGVNMLLSGIATIASANASVTPDFHVFNLLREIEVIRDSTTVMRISGQRLAALFTYRNHVAAPDNLALVGTVAVGTAFQHFLPLVFAADDLAVPEDQLMDTRAHKYVIRVTWNNIQTQGVMFGTNFGNVSVVNADDVTLQFDLERLGTISLGNKADKYANASPKMRGLVEVPAVVSQTGQISVDFPVDKTVRNVFFYATEVSGNVELGRNTVLTGDILIENTNNKTFHRQPAKMVRQKTGQAFGLGSGTPNGLYGINLTRFGNIVDSLKDMASSRLRAKLDATKLTGNTTVYAIFDTVEDQGTV